MRLCPGYGLSEPSSYLIVLELLCENILGKQDAIDPLEIPGRVVFQWSPLPG